LPHVDEHSIKVDGAPEPTWRALLLVVERSFGSPSTKRFARLLGCADTYASGPRPLALDSTLPGFHVEAATEPKQLTLAGAHRFSDYALIFRLDGESGGPTLVRAETRASFPGLKGSLYRAGVIGTRLHVLVTRRLLTATKRIAERP
jgi:hypothetical protein